MAPAAGVLDRGNRIPVVSLRSTHRLLSGMPPASDFCIHWRLNSEEWVDHPDGVVGLAVVQVFGIEGLAAEFLGGGKDRGVIIADPVTKREVQRPEDQAGCGGEHRI